MDKSDAYDLITEIAKLRAAQQDANTLAEEVAGPKCGHGYRLWTCAFCRAREGYPFVEGSKG